MGIIILAPEKKAKELVQKFKAHSFTKIAVNYDCYNAHGIVKRSRQQEESNTISAKECALIAVDEVLALANIMDGGFSFEKEISYWELVKQEIEKL